MKHNYIIKFFFGILFIAFCTILYSRFIGTSGLKIKEYNISNDHIPNNFNGLKIVHFSDVHYGRTINNERLKEIVEEINSLNPDIVVFTGDLIDRTFKLTSEEENNISTILSDINPKINKYAIKGNHDYNFENWESIIKNSGFINLNNTYDYIYKEGYEPILIAGLNSLNDKDTIENRYNNIINKYNNEDIKSQYNILIMHEPDSIDNININNFSLVLAGHSHNGQIRLPQIGALVKPDGAEKYYDEYYKINNTDLYISSGIGTSILDFRLFNRPSINLYRLNKRQDA